MAYDWTTGVSHLSVVVVGENTYYIKDAEARAAIDDLASKASAGLQWKGIASAAGDTTFADNITTNPVTVNGTSFTAVANDVVAQDGKEFVFNGTAWQEFGSTGSLGSLADQDTATGSFTPLGSITTETFTGSSTTFDGTFTPNLQGAMTASVSGETVTFSTVTGQSQAIEASGTPLGSVDVSWAGSSTSVTVA